MACLDTTALIDLGSARPDRARRAGAAVAAALARNEVLYTTRINDAELRVGIYRARDPDRERERVERALAGCVMLEFDGTAADRFGRIKTHLLDVGRPTGDADVMIAAICLVAGERIITRNSDDFANVPGLIVQGY
jgi:predicted nucleic acid-binding protein